MSYEYGVDIHVAPIIDFYFLPGECGWLAPINIVSPKINACIE